MKQTVTNPTETIPEATLTMGDATFKLSYEIPLSAYGTLKIEDGTQTFLESQETLRIQYSSFDGKVIGVRGGLYTIFDTLLQDNSHNLSIYAEGTALNSELHVLIVTPETFKAIRGESQPPNWAGVYVWDGTVVYNAEYISNVLGGGGVFGGKAFDIQYFYEEMRHELLHSYEDSTFFKGNVEMSKHFSSTSLWFKEGLKETMGRDLSALPAEEFKRGYQDVIETYPEFSINTLNTNFWQYDTSPTNKNIAYQYCRKFLWHLSPTLNKKAQDYEKSLERGALQKIHAPFEGAYVILQKAVERYEQGKRESIIDVMEDVFDLSRKELEKIEKEWVANFLN